MRVGIITQARMTSTRLPGKVMMKSAGRTFLEYHVNRLSQVGVPIVIATTVNATDNVIVDFCIQHNLKYFRGDEFDVLSRYYSAAKESNFDVIVRVTSDCPLIDPQIIKSGVDRFIENNNPMLYVSNVINRTFPRGFDFEVFSFEYLSEANNCASEPYMREHVTPYIHQNISGSTIFQHIVGEVDSSYLRVTLDTIEDFNLLNELILSYKASELTSSEIIEILESKPELVELNKVVEQKKLKNEQ